ncbi:LIC_11090 family protein [Leptospira yanagawae]|nr:hypothetical protein [Leptospira yanagawae]
MMNRWIQIIAILFLIPFFGKILLLESGLFAQSLYELSMVCHCNHSSPSEAHQESENFPKKRITCHLKRTTGPHICTCSKKKMATKIIQSQSMNPNFANDLETINLLQLDPILITKGFNLLLPLGFCQLLDKPPKHF